LGAARREVVLVTKAGYIPGADGAQSVMKRPIAQRFDRAYLTWACEMSLWRLGTDYLDVFLLHDYLLASHDPQADATEEPFEALHRLKEAGKIRHYGDSATPAVAQVAIERFGAEVVEVPFNLLEQRAAQFLFPLAAQRGVGILARSPFAQGRLFRPGSGTPGAVPDLRPFVRPPATSLAALAIKFVLSYATAASVVTGIMGQAELDENSAAANPPFLSPDQVAELAGAGVG
jgi:aryl-alcohol dehydrogenase-like predicted oxidoreductase